MKKILAGISAAILMLGAGSGRAAIIDIYYESFSGDVDTNLHGRGPETRPGTETWSASTFFKANGSIAVPTSTATDRRGAYLPFTPVQGNIYQLSADLRADPRTTSNEWVALGFSEKAATNVLFSEDNTAGLGWAFVRVNGGVGILRGRRASGEVASSGDTLSESDMITVKITFDATAPLSADWTMAWHLADQSGNVRTAPESLVHTGNYANIRHVGLNAFQVPGVVDNFSLQIIPEPGSVVLVGLGALALLRFRRRR